MEIFIVIISWLLFGGASSYFASQRGRDPFSWFIIGMLLGILGLLLLFLLPSINQEESVDLKESKEKESFDLDDNSYLLKAWYYLDDQSQQIGPNSFNQMKAAERLGKLHPETLVWCEGMEDWTALSGLPEISEALR